MLQKFTLIVTSQKMHLVGRHLANQSRATKRSGLGNQSKSCCESRSLLPWRKVYGTCLHHTSNNQGTGSIQSLISLQIAMKMGGVFRKNWILVFRLQWYRWRKGSNCHPQKKGEEILRNLDSSTFPSAKRHWRKPANGSDTLRAAQQRESLRIIFPWKSCSARPEKRGKKELKDNLTIAKA